MFKGSDGRVCDASPLQSSNCLLPSFVCCLSCLLHIQLCRCLLIIVRCAEIGGGGCLDDLRCAVLMYCGSCMLCVVVYRVWCVLNVCCIVLY